MQNKILKTTGKNVETLYLTYTDSGNRDSPVNTSQRRQIFKPTNNSYAKILLATSSSTFPTVARLEGL